MSNKLALCALLLVAFVFTTSVSVDAQRKNGKVKGSISVEVVTTEANDAASLEQCRNGATVETGVGCVNSANGLGWATGNAGSQNSHWAEDQFLTYRALFSNLPTGVENTVTIGYDILKDGVHAIDYLGTYNYTEKLNNPCFGVDGCSSWTVDTIEVPEDGVTVTNNDNLLTGEKISQIPGVITLWGGTITGIDYENYTGGNERQITITFIPEVPNPVMAWGGHVAWQGDWGANNSAGGITGSPYHMSLVSLNGAVLGNQERSLSADAVLPSGVLIIRKQVETPDGSNQSNEAFTFSASRDFSPLQFSLIDDNEGSGSDFKQSDGISLFGPNNPITVIETPAGGFELLRIECTESVTVNSSTNPLTNTLTAVVDLREVVDCTFTNGVIAPTAAPAVVTGRVTDSYGRGIYNARVEVINVVSGETQAVTTNSFGFYRFDEVETGESYVMTVSHKRYRFVNGTVFFSLTADVSGMDFVASN